MCVEHNSFVLRHLTFIVYSNSLLNLPMMKSSFFMLCTCRASKHTDVSVFFIYKFVANADEKMQYFGKHLCMF